MKVINIHKRVINQPLGKISELFGTLSTPDDQVLATDKWSPMILSDGLKPNSKGGHGPIRYTVEAYDPGKFVQFQFTRPTGFHGTHRFEIIRLDENSTEIKHIIDMNTSGSGSLIWLGAIRWLHDAYIEDAFDRVENHFLTEKKKTQWNLWVRFLRNVLKPKGK